MSGKSISVEIKKLIAEAKSKGETDREIAARFYGDNKSVSNIYKKWREEKKVKA